jgi:hypothetical protein
MLRKSITFTNFDGKKVTEEFFFKADVIKLEVTDEGFADRLIQIGELDVKVPGNAAKILQMFEDMIKAAFGKKVGDHFVKRELDWEEFVAGNAYSELLMELVTDGAYAAQFIKGILPPDLDTTEIDKAAKALESGVEDIELPAAADIPAPPGDDEVLRLPAWYRERREPTYDELRDVGQDEMLLAFKVKSQGFPPLPE